MVGRIIELTLSIDCRVISDGAASACLASAADTMHHLTSALEEL